jgi:hypothetical protein
MSTKQDQEEIRLRAKRECTNLRTAMAGRGCTEGEIEKRCQEIMERAENRANQLKTRDER